MHIYVCGPDTSAKDKFVEYVSRVFHCDRTNPQCMWFPEQNVLLTVSDEVPVGCTAVFFHQDATVPLVPREDFYPVYAGKDMCPSGQYHMSKRVPDQLIKNLFGTLPVVDFVPRPKKLKRMHETARVSSCMVCKFMLSDPVTPSCGHTQCTKCYHSHDLCQVCRYSNRSGFFY